MGLIVRLKRGRRASAEDQVEPKRARAPDPAAPEHTLADDMVRLHYAPVQSGKGAFIAATARAAVAEGGRVLVLSMNSAPNCAQVQSRLKDAGVPALSLASSARTPARSYALWGSGAVRAITGLFNATSLELAEGLLSGCGGDPCTAILDEGDFLLSDAPSSAFAALRRLLSSCNVTVVWVVTATPVEFYVPSPLLPHGIRGDMISIGEAPANYMGIDDLEHGGIIPETSRLATHPRMVPANDDAFYKFIPGHFCKLELTPAMVERNQPYVLLYNGATTNDAQEKVAGILTALGVTAIVANQKAARVSGPAARRAGLSTKAGTLVTCDKCPGGFREVLTALLRPSAGHERGAAHHPHIVLVGFQSAKRGTNFATLDHTVSLTHQWLVSAQDGGCWEGLAQSLRCMGVKPEKADPVKVWASEDIMDAIGRGYDAANWICRQARSGGANSNTVRAAAEYARQTETLNVRYGRNVGKDIKTSQKKRLS